MSKYDLLWKFIEQNGSGTIQLTFEQINEIAGVPIDHSFPYKRSQLIESN